MDAIYQNAKGAKALTRPGTKFMAVIKADGYGHGAVPLAKALENVADAYGVATLEEGVELRQAGVVKPILILGVTPVPLYQEMLVYDIAATIFQLDMARELSRTAVRLGRKARVHIKLDTGMSRIGFLPGRDSIQAVKQIAALPGIDLEGCFTHFARMDERDKTKAREQLDRYLKFVEELRQEGVQIPIRHASNSAGILEMEEANLDMVRDGICLYGLYPSEEVNKNRLELIPAMGLRAYISYVKTLPAGVEVGYGGTYTTKRTTRVATIPVGYADGYPRALSNQGRVLVRGQSAPIIGRVCMDQFMVDVTDIPEAGEGDRVTLFGRDGEAYISVEEVAEMACSFNYEMVCSVGKRVPRVYYRNGKVVDTRDYYPDE